MGSAPVEPACQLCRKVQLDPDIYGVRLEQDGMCVHNFCVFFASGISPVASASDWVSYSPSDVRRVIEEAAEKRCHVCGRRGAAIVCRERRCERRFHLPCAVRGRCLTQYYGSYRAYCSRHRPRQAMGRDPEPGTECLLCLEEVGRRKSFRTMGCPTCQHAWFHRSCIQGHALRAGSSAFQCMLCRDKEDFQAEMLYMGIRIPARPPAWDTLEDLEGLMARHGRCDATECLCPAGREQAEEEGPWQLLLCSSCAAEGTHRSCSSLSDSAASWECQGCAGPGAAASARQAAAGPEQGSAEPEGSSPAAAPGPVWQRVGSRLQRRAEQSPYSRARRRR
ncbi:PHD finger protein 7-like [Pogoniulus pusillus]